ncbi:MAG: DUF4906 domain-containing protein, partial [Prevotellaceae bacterium]|nr:DUF4906 domain-containing protein [Prevotellaceae bacterium]
MKKTCCFIFVACLAAALSLTGCTDEPAPAGGTPPAGYNGNPVNACLDISVGALSVSMGTKADMPAAYSFPDTEAERRINDLWVFQFDAATGAAVAPPAYRTVEDEDELSAVPVMLSDNNGRESVVYVVANTGSPAWGTRGDFSTAARLKASALPTREPVFVTADSGASDLSIPMQGDSGAVLVDEKLVVPVPVTRMYAKLMIDPYVELTDAEVYSVGVGNVPLYCRVETLSNGLDETQAAAYPDDVVWISRTFTESMEGGDGNATGYRYVVYVPENLEGQTAGGDDGKVDDTDTPERALAVNIVISHKDEQGGVMNYPYTFYPGANTTNDYNIKRNNIYRVKANIRALSEARVPSANCMVAMEGETLSFFPYYRVETGGGYDFTDYLDPSGGRGEKIDHLGIVWQTPDCIGDNSDGSKVFMSTRGVSHNGYERVYVQTNKEGNALVAAYNAQDQIIWSWHIWVRTPSSGDPTNLANALVYYTYYWNEKQIYSEGSGVGRIAGYQIMPCNIGALQDEPDWDTFNTKTATVSVESDVARTFGMLYQWGRKDPFPPMTNSKGPIGNNNQGINTGYHVHNYNEGHTQTLYGNDNKTKVTKDSKETDDLFHTHVAQPGEGIRYAIQHPTVFLCGTKEIAHCYDASKKYQKADSTEYVKHKGNYMYGGAWSDEDHDNKEWGGLEPDENMKHLGLGIYHDEGGEITLYDDYGEEKSIFDPCPYGWRVAS